MDATGGQMAAFPSAFTIGRIPITCPACRWPVYLTVTPTDSTASTDGRTLQLTAQADGMELALRAHFAQHTSC